MHDPNVVVLGTGQSSAKEVVNFNADPATFLAGLAVRMKSDGTLSTAKADGGFFGISMGRSLSNIKRTSVCRDGLRLPILLESAPARGVVTITSYANLVATSNDTLKVGATTFTFKASPSTESEVGAVTSNNQTATNLAAKINAHSVAGPLFSAQAVGPVVTITSKNNSTAGSSIDLIYTDTHAEIGLTVDHATFTGGSTTAADYVSVGAPVYISDTTGKADDPQSSSSISNAVYASGVMSGLQEDGTTVACALIDFQGGL